MTQSTPSCDKFGSAVDESSGGRHPFDFTLNIAACSHAIERISERLSMSPGALMSILNKGRSICISSPFRNDQCRGRYLFYSEKDKDFYVAIIGISIESKSGTLITILTREQFENDIGEELAYTYKKRAVHSVVSEKDYIKWCKEYKKVDLDEKNAAGNYKNLRLRIDYWDESSRSKSVIFSYPPISADFLLSKSIRQLLEVQIFSEWLVLRIRKKNIPVDRIVGAYLIFGFDQMVELEL